MPISVNAVGKPSMIAATISASISSPRCPPVSAVHGVRINAAATISPRIETPKISSLRIEASPYRAAFSSSWCVTIALSLSTSTSSTSSCRLGHSPSLRHTMQRRISTTPWMSSSAPATGMTALNG